MKSLGPYPPLRRRGGWIFVSGMSARQADGSVPGDAGEQTRIVIEKIRTALAGEGATLADCVSLTCYLTDMRDFAAYNRAYGECFADIATAPARTTVAVHQLPHPDMRIEITATALLAEAAP